MSLFVINYVMTSLLRNTLKALRNYVQKLPVGPLSVQQQSAV